MTAALTIFALMALLDFVWARYTIAIQHQQHALASLMAGVIFLLNGLVTLAFVAEHWLLLPAFIGAVVGTYAGSRFVKKVRV